LGFVKHTTQYFPENQFLFFQTIFCDFFWQPTLYITYDLFTLPWQKNPVASLQSFSILISLRPLPSYFQMFIYQFKTLWSGLSHVYGWWVCIFTSCRRIYSPLFICDTYILQSSGHQEIKKWEIRDERLYINVVNALISFISNECRTVPPIIYHRI
jgi:hypothetical protein